MSKVKIREIISFSSEDPAHPASNLLENATFRKWKCKQCGESEACVIFQLDSAVSITGIDIGNESSAMVEVLVSRSADSTKTFKVLLSAAMLMSPLESRDLQYRNRVKMFRKDKLDRSVMAEKWDVVKVVCTQPYNKHTQYGLSFITFFKDADINDNKPKIGAFTILPTPEEENDESPKMGSLFAKRKEAPPSQDPTKDSPRVSSAVLLRASPSTSSFATGSKVQDLVAKQASKSSDNNNQPSTNSPRQTQVTQTKSSKTDSPSTTQKAVSSISSSPSTSKSAGVTASSQPAKVAQKKKKMKPFNKLFEDVLFVMSGFENPYRGQLRQKALDMGAKCKPDWNSTCTHLICAFVNTPKFRQVRVAGNGKIVTNNWIEESYRKRCRLPWRRYCTDRNDRGPESEEEIYDEDQDQDSNSDQAGDNNDRNSDSEQNSNSNSEEVSPAKKRKRIQIVDSSDEEDQEEKKSANENELYDDDTDVDEDVSDKPNPIGMFTATVFYIDPEWSLLQEEQRKEIIQIIKNGNGTISSSLTDHVNFFITHHSDWNEDFSEALAENPNLVFVRGEWVTECGRKGEKVQHDSFMILPE